MDKVKSYTCIGCGITIETDDEDEQNIMDLWPFVCGDECLKLLQEREAEARNVS